VRLEVAALALAVVALAVATAVVWGKGDDDAPPSATASAAALDGRALFSAKGCAVCHFGPGATDGFEIGPDLTDIAEVGGSRVPGLDAAAYVRQSIAEPDAFGAAPSPTGGPYGTMPRLAVSPAELDALVAYLVPEARPR